ncbi:MAG: hypothetical protein HZA89_08175 [Verrucomicrobia bacterium]|nr:hypothetical protein [Verrucomicrobiota bacterium]
MKPKFVSLLCLAIFLPASLSAAVTPPVKLLRTPNGGLQPQAVAGADGTVHLIYHAGPEMGGDVFYTRAAAGSDAWAKPIQVNRQRGSAIAAGTIRGAQLALGKNGRVHVVWNGSAKTLGVSNEKAPLFHARLNDAGTAFEPERNIITFAYGLDGGSSVGADDAGNVFVVWHGRVPDGARGEEGRGVFLAKSADEGKTFLRERQINPATSGVCPCCGVKAFAGPGGTVAVLYRLAKSGLVRDEQLLLSRDGGQTFQVAASDPWKIGQCPMSSSSLTLAKSGVLAAWETAGQVSGALLDSTRPELKTRFTPEGAGQRKHPVIAGNPRGEVLLAWTEGTGWKRGGRLAWQLFDAGGKPTAEKGARDGVPAWGLATAFAQPDGNFVVVY